MAVPKISPRCPIGCPLGCLPDIIPLVKVKDDIKRLWRAFVRSAQTILRTEGIWLMIVRKLGAGSDTQLCLDCFEWENMSMCD